MTALEENEYAVFARMAFGIDSLQHGKKKYRLSNSFSLFYMITLKKIKN